MNLRMNLPAKRITSKVYTMFVQSQHHKAHTVHSDLKVWFWVTSEPVTILQQCACTDLGLFEFCFQDL